MPQVSIVLPCYNAADTLQATLDSLLAQTRTDWEAICVDDGSTDATRTILADAALRDRRIRLMRNPGRGPSAARNAGAQAAQGRILAFLDADDLWAPQKIDRLVAAFAGTGSGPATDGVFARVAFFRTDPAAPGTVSARPQATLDVATLLGENPVCTMSNLALRRDLFVEAGGFDEGMVHAEDLELLIRLVGGGARIQGLDEVLVSYRTSAAGLSSDLSAMAAGRAAALATARRLGHSPCRRAEAIHLRYLARRALRLSAGRVTALTLALRGLRASPRGFFSPPRRGGLVAAGALAALVLPRPVNRALFAR
ncbi:glycosyltransferase family 2 protein [Mesobaculum littorinae]|uniref:Glycosyltransferase family 2 protein n=1 Tax=Mesobaculum littorinae TaxID=2486419 RepID=A0A438AD60_9RHOB|nr:glycosyltransferase family 2 protein [Mesobaculum littorinae]